MYRKLDFLKYSRYKDGVKLPYACSLILEPKNSKIYSSTFIRYSDFQENDDVILCFLTVSCDQNSD